MWTYETSNGNETAKCRNHVVQDLHGLVLDVGCGNEKVIPQAVGVDLFSPSADIRTDLSKPYALYLFGNNVADVVYSSHFLEHLYDYKGMLREMARVLKPHGKLILYLPHKDLYPNIGEYGANPDHKHDLLPEDITGALGEIGAFKILRDETFSDEDEYSFLIVAEELELPGVSGVYSEPQGKRPSPSVCIVRYGGFGDTLMVTPLFRYFKERGYYVCFNCTPECEPVLIGNPYIDEIIYQQRQAIPNTLLKPYNDVLKRDFDLFIPLHESIERTLLVEKRDGGPFYLPHEERHALCNKNYYDFTAEKAGLDVRGLRPELYLIEAEEILGRVFQERNKDYFVIQWQSAGSSWHKVYPHSPDVICDLVERAPDIKILLTGDDSVDMLYEPHPRIVSMLGRFGIRQSMIMTKFVDLVVSPETGVFNASGAFDTPKIGLMTHSSKENLTKYFVNDYSLESSAPCHPCHRLIHNLEDCECDETFGLPVCMSRYMEPERVIEQVMAVYTEWKNKRLR